MPISERKANKISLRVAFKRAEELKLQLRHKYQEAYNKQLEEKVRWTCVMSSNDVITRRDWWRLNVRRK